MGFEPYHEEVELLAAGGAPRGRGPSGGRERRGPRGDLRVDAWELVDGGGDAEAGDVRLQEALVERVRRDGRLLPLPADAGGEAARVRRRRGRGGRSSSSRRRRGVHGEPVVGVVERHRRRWASGVAGGEYRGAARAQRPRRLGVLVGGGGRDKRMDG